MEYFSNSQFRNKTYLIFGGSSGIGLSTGKRLHSLGAKIIIAGRSAEKISQESGLGEGFLGKFIDFNSDSSIENFLNFWFRPFPFISCVFITFDDDQM